MEEPASQKKMDTDALVWAILKEMIVKVSYTTYLSLLDSAVDRNWRFKLRSNTDRTYSLSVTEKITYPNMDMFCAWRMKWSSPLK